LDSCVIRSVDSKINLLDIAVYDPERYPFLLQSVAHGTAQARYDILFAFPGETIVLDDLQDDSDFLNQLDHCYRREKTLDKLAAQQLPFYGGWFIYLSYELAQQIEPTLSLPQLQSDLPVAFATRIPAAMIWDHKQSQLLLIAEKDQQPLLDQLESDLNAVTPISAPAISINQVTEDTPEFYTDAVERIKKYIVDGDVFQVNLSRAWQAQVSSVEDKAAALYQRLCSSNPAPFAGLVRYKNHAIISSSPERLVRVRDDIVDTRPIAGTRPRGQGLSHDEAKRKELIGHPKERAEHIMLIDLERNDLGRIAKPGTVQVDELMTLESYAHVHHIVSNVRAELREGITPGEVIRAVFPGGTITGCPKVRCMEIIAELEQVGRGPYTGSMGYLNRDGSMDLNILIRTLHLHDDLVTLRAGAGIVYDSQAEWELKETRAKARGLLLALGCELD
jgi:anthranilate synthase component 1